MKFVIIAGIVLLILADLFALLSALSANDIGSWFQANAVFLFISGVVTLVFGPMAISELRDE